MPARQAGVFSARYRPDTGKPAHAATRDRPNAANAEKSGKHQLTRKLNLTIKFGRLRFFLLFFVALLSSLKTFPFPRKQA
jgi:hypothetical protein